MATECACGNVLSETPRFKITKRPCTCEVPAPPPSHSGFGFVRGAPRDPKRAKLGLPDRTPYEKAVLKGTFHE